MLISKIARRFIVPTFLALALGACSDEEGDGGGAKPCGNGKIDTGEICDGTNLNGETCAKVTMGARPNGTLTCSASCTANTNACTGASGAGGSGGGGGVSGGGGMSGSGGMAGGSAGQAGEAGGAGTSGGGGQSGADGSAGTGGSAGADSGAAGANP